MILTFQVEVSEAENTKRLQWEEEQIKRCEEANVKPMFGDYFEYRISPTFVGDVLTVYCSPTKETLEVTDFNNF